MPSTNRVSVLLLLCLFFLSLLPYFTKYDLSTVWTAVVGVTELLGWLSGKESACSAGDAGEMGSAPGSGRSPGGGHGNPLLPGESHGQRSLVGYSPKELQRIRHN